MAPGITLDIEAVATTEPSYIWTSIVHRRTDMASTASSHKDSPRELRIVAEFSQVSGPCPFPRSASIVDLNAFPSTGARPPSPSTTTTTSNNTHELPQPINGFSHLPPPSRTSKSILQCPIPCLPDCMVVLVGLKMRTVR